MRTSGFFLLLPLLWERVNASWLPQSPFLDHSTSANSTAQAEPKVDVTLYVMSRCPDARLCEGVFEDVLKTKDIQEKINFNMQFIGRLNHSEPLGLSCKHGQLECVGNAHDLCLQKYLPLTPFYASVSCQNFQSPFPGKIGDVALTRRCAEASKVDWWESGVGQCIQGKKAKKDDGKKATGKGKLAKEARKLVLENVVETAKRGVTKSCTIEIGSTKGIDGKRVCIVDDGVWTGCDDGHTASDFVRVIEEEYKAIQPKTTV